MNFSENLERLYQRFNRKEFLASDPLEYPHGYADPHDQEIVAILSALVAYGNAKQVRASISKILNRMKREAETPSKFVELMGSNGGRRRVKKALEGIYHRFNVAEDFYHLFGMIYQSRSEFGTVGGQFLSFHDPSAESIEVALNKLTQNWKARAVRAKAPRSFFYFLTSPADGSTCKRWTMLLKWMGRKDNLDLGLWGQGEHSIRPSQLIMPLDTHVARISEYLGFKKRRTLNWKASLEVTAAFKKVSSDDPTRFDFAISRLGILDICQKKFRKEVCHRCDLLEVCLYANQKLEEL